MDSIEIERLRGTAACDRNGRPLVLCHGTPYEFGAFSPESDIGVHFGSQEQSRRRETDKRRETKRTRDPSWTWKVRKAALAVTRVLVYPDDPRSWTNWAAVTGLCRLADPSFLRQLKNEGVADPETAALRVRDRLLELGYDAIAYRNLFESASGPVSEWSWIALDPATIVDLPPETETIPDAVGNAGAAFLPADTREIPGARSRTGSIRYWSDRKALDEALAAAAGERGWNEAACREGFGRRFTIQAAGLEGRLETMTDIGRLTLRLHPDMDDACERTADDFVVFVGLSSERHAGPASLVFQWQPGETATAFVTRALEEVDYVCGIHAETELPAPGR